MSEPDFKGMRAAMVKSQLRTTEVNEPWVIAAMSAVPREAFVGSALAGVVYHDRSVPLGHGRMMNPPLVTGRMLVEAAPLPHERALVVAGGTGYVAALLARMVSHVTMVEERPELVAEARERLAHLTNVSVVEAPVTVGPGGEAPFDLMLIDGAVEQIPPALVKQLREDGRLVTGLADGAVTRLAVGRRVGDDVPLYAFADLEVAPLPEFRRAEAFRF